MKLRCPYCQQLFGPEPRATCPHCGKAMLTPDRLQRHPLRERKRAKARIARQAERKRQDRVLPDAAIGRRPGAMVLVVIVMLVLGGLLVSRLRVRSAGTTTGRVLTAQRNLQTLRIALERFRMDCGRYPAREESLRALVADPGAAGWKGPYVNMVRADPWGRAFIYEPSATNVVLRSRGPDGNAGTPDDLAAGPPSAEEVAR